VDDTLNALGKLPSVFTKIIDPTSCAPVFAVVNSKTSLPPLEALETRHNGVGVGVTGVLVGAAIENTNPSLAEHKCVHPEQFNPPANP